MDIQDIDLKQLIERETGERFNRQGYIKCPFHLEKTPSLSVKFNPDTNKDFFKCFGCGECGDAIDFIMKYKNLGYKEARKYLGLEVEYTEAELQEEKIKKYIDWELDKFRQVQELLGIFKFVNDKNEIVYFKAKFKLPDGKKQLSYYHLEGDKVIAKRGTDEVPYNLYNALQAIGNNYVLVVVEGEKDANTINSIFKNKDYVATSLKNCKNLDVLTKTHPEKVFVLGDTGQAGEKYKWEIYNNFNQNCRDFRFVNLPGIRSMGDNKDVTDWIEVGHTKKDLLNAFDRSLNIKSKFELQQNKYGIYKTIIKEKGDDIEERNKYLTNFIIVDAARIKIIDEDKEGVKLILKSPTGAIIEKSGLSTVFDDTKTFKNFLGTLDLAFKGRADDLTELKEWINKYFALETQELHSGVKFTDRNGKLTFIENNGAINKEKIDFNIKSDGRNNANVLDVEHITKEELKELKKHIFKFSASEKSLSIIGTAINNLTVYQAQQLKQKFHHLLIVGESGSGKSTILENVIAPIFNYPKSDIRSIGLITTFALIKTLADGNYPVLFDEFKPSSLDRYKVLSLSETLRNLYDRATISKGNKSLKTRDFTLTRPLIMAGEESYPNQEKALIERSCIVYLARKERTGKSTKSMKWIIENEDILRKFGRSLIEIVLGLTSGNYKNIRNEAAKYIKGLNNRALTTAINICSGISIFNLLLNKHDLKEIPHGYEDLIVENIKEEVLDGAGETYSLVERMLILYNDMIEDGRAFGNENVVKYRGDGIFIKTSEMINQIHEHVNRVGADLIPLKLKDFRKQAQKAGYLEGLSNKTIKINSKTVRFDTYNRDMLRELKVNAIIPPEIMDVTDEDNVIPFNN
ncbi:CHC2 zinc finger domain-containing protein [Clostridium brassicae]|uniref:CHC2 zinc finger domain-containing protein n=1 Tax=Clostridium brassicae TaxID=2999072 RepID=A0ABT4D966_9CLOT|nr:CHC2 zinc finger domain-containing protein [Clostridium brassicae]MCY6958847.1 CHC2 zinc finger domain-containing protein [Clostridium brassicae]